MSQKDGKPEPSRALGRTLAAPSNVVVVKGMCEKDRGCGSWTSETVSHMML